jgi:hypothetical protein
MVRKLPFFKKFQLMTCTCASTANPSFPSLQSAVEETLARIALMGGVTGFIICNGDGGILRQSKGLTARDAAAYAAPVLVLTNRARHAVRDLDPKVSERAERMGFDEFEYDCIFARMRSGGGGGGGGGIYIYVMTIFQNEACLCKMGEDGSVCALYRERASAPTPG